MLNKKTLLSLSASVLFTTCISATVEMELNNEFLKKTNTILKGKIDRAELPFKADGRQATEEYWIMTSEQFNSLKNLIEYATIGYKIVSDEKDKEKKHIEFTNKLAFKENNHICNIRKASLIEKIIMCVKEKSIKPFLENPFVRVPNSANFSHVAIRCNIKVNPFEVDSLKSRLYPNVPVTSEIGNLPGIYVRSNGKTSKKGGLVGFSYRAEKNGVVKDFFFGKLWKEDK